MNPSIAYFVTPHGFGHAARAAAVMTALQKVVPDLHFEIFTLVPEWFFAEAEINDYQYHSLRTDVGLVQDGPLSENIPSTLAVLDTTFPYPDDLIQTTSQQLIRSRCLAVISDISPLGVLAARKSRIPAFLIENFTWDWIYENYSSASPGFQRHIEYLSRIYQNVDHHILAVPFCKDHPGASLIANPISRSPKIAAKEIRTSLGIKNHEKMILVTMGGIPGSFTNLEQLTTYANTVFVIPGGGKAHARTGNLILLPHHSPYYHPDLISACDVAIGKAGYSTIAELYHAGIPFGYISRSSFRESSYLTKFIESKMQGIELFADNSSDRLWIDHQLPGLLSLSKIYRDEVNGAHQTAEFILNSSAI